MISSGRNRAYWEQRLRQQEYPTLEADTHVDVVVVGAGITGLSTALRLQREGRRVAVLELNRIGSGTTGHSTGHLDAHVEPSLDNLIHQLGRAQARLVVESRLAAIDQVERNCRELSIDCDFQRIPAYYYCETAEGREQVTRELAAAQRLGLRSELRNGDPLPFTIELSLRLARQARFSPLAYVQGLAKAFVEADGLLFEQTRAENIEGRSGQTCEVKTSGGIVTAHDVILAGHSPMLGLFSTEPRVYPQQSYVLGVRVADDVPDALYWDTDEPYHYTRLAMSDEPDLLIIGGEDHPTGSVDNEQASFNALEQYAYERYDVKQIEQRWSHELWVSADGLPYIGEVPGMEGVQIATGFAGDGLTYGSLAGQLLSDAVLGKENPWAGIYTPSRVRPLASAKKMTAGVLHIARHFVGDRLAGGEVDSIEDVPPGEGRLVQINGEKLAVYRDDRDRVRAMSPVCQHRGCLVQWNNAERTWDCPCHGGRYDAQGRVIMGPPTSDLPVRDVRAAK
ncbi:FAD-dependent oxidoreductase [Phycisphaerales bacterium AB-hyl4]|uniref:FAD-dependent oxidoreductase n=1 Tax=Natronomicrosphaera hydrolytica TaxID=3242702 RepID=A0ABV4U8N6_9BACT